MSEFELRDDAPVPNTEMRVSKYPFRLMQVGQSFIVPKGKVETVRRAATKYRERKMPWAYKLGRDAGGNVRLWRVADTPKHIKGRKRTL